MKNLLKLTLLSSALILASCGDSPEEKAAKEAAAQEAAAAKTAALQVCAPENVLTNIDTYSNDVADTSLDQAAWFEANGKREGVTTTASGLQYSVNTSGNDKGPHPVPTQKVRVHYHGQFIDGKKFDSSYDRGQDITFPLNGVIKGWTEGVALMRPCDAWTFYIPSDLAYGDAGRGGIPPKSPLMFHVQLIEISE
jgi:FKBP-type peptidyl-prolyl cis-trans isomerase